MRDIHPAITELNKGVTKIYNYNMVLWGTPTQLSYSGKNPNSSSYKPVLFKLERSCTSPQVTKIKIPIL